MPSPTSAKPECEVWNSSLDCSIMNRFIFTPEVNFHWVKLYQYYADKSMHYVHY